MNSKTTNADTQPTRRTFLTWAGITLGNASLLTLPACFSTPPPAPPKTPAPPVPPASPPKKKTTASIKWLINAKQRAFIKAVANVIIPVDEDPGANDVDVPAFYNTQVEHGSSNPEFLKAGMQAIDAIIAEEFAPATTFADLSSTQQEIFMEIYFDRTIVDNVQVEGTMLEQLVYKLLVEIFNCTRSCFYNSQLGYDMLGYIPPIEGHTDYFEAPGP